MAHRMPTRRYRRYLFALAAVLVFASGVGTPVAAQPPSQPPVVDPNAAQPPAVDPNAAQPPAVDPNAPQPPGVPGKIDQVVLVGYDLNPTQQKELNDLSQAAQAGGAQSTALFADAANPDQLVNAMQSAIGLASNTIVPPAGGAPVLPGMDANLPVIVASGLLGASVLLLIAIVLVRRPAGGRAAPAVPASDTRVSAGLSIVRPDGGASTFRITGSRTTIGRAPGNTLVIDDGEASGHHAEILVSRDGFRLRDVGSSNGTRVNGQGVTDVFLSLGDEIGIGGTTLTLTE